MKISKLVLCALIAAPLAVLNAQQGPDEFEGEEMMGPAPMGLMGRRMDSDQFGPYNRMKKGMAGMHNRMMRRKGLDMPEEMKEKVMEVIKRNDPAVAEKLARLKETNEKSYDLIIAEAARFLTMAKNAGDNYNEKDVVRAIGLEYEVRTLSMSYEKASDADKGKIKEQIRAKLNDLFDIRYKFHELRIKKLENEIAEIKKGMETRKANRSKIVEQRLEHLIGNKYLSW